MKWPDRELTASMSTQFELRALDDDSYAVVVELLKRIALGGAEALSLLVERTRVAARAPELRGLNAASSVFRLADDTLDALTTPNAATARELAQLALPCCCFPGFQFHYLSAFEVSPTLVILGDSDGGLFGVSRAALPWFDAWLEQGLSVRAEQFPYGRVMFRVTIEERERFASALPALVPRCDEASSPEHCRAALKRLFELLALVSRDRLGLVLCET